MKKVIYLAMGATVIFAASCKKDFKSEKELILSGNPAIADTLAGEITVNTTVTKTTYLDGLVYVKPGVTLTINPGVKIIGSTGPAIPDTVNLRNNKGTLCVQKGGKLIANGTAGAPIIWTSEQAVGSRHFGDWGGVVLYGNAPIHRANGASNGLFEAFDFKPDERNRYGGTDSLDAASASSITFNRFEFGGGIVYQINKEVNGFTMCGVGAATTFHHNEIQWSGDDGIEFFGGTVNIDHILVYEPHDDNYDFDEGYRGYQQFIIGYQTTNNDNSGSHFIESDNDASATNAFPHTNPFITNATFIGPQVAQNYQLGLGGPINNHWYDGGLQIRRNSRIKLANSIIDAEKQPYAVVTTPTTYPLVANIPSLADSIVIAFNIFQTSAATSSVVKSVREGNPVDSLFTLTTDVPLLNKLGNPATNNNSAVAAFANFKLDGVLKPLTGSPALSGGVSLAGIGNFVGTTQRGAVRTTDVWTLGSWISVANN